MARQTRHGEGETMQSNTSQPLFSARTIGQVTNDARRAVLSARYIGQLSRISQPRCVDDQSETEERFGRQMWYFEGEGATEDQRRARLFGVLEYSIEFGLSELVEGGVFEQADQRERFRDVYFNHQLPPSWSHPGHRWLLAGLALVSALTLLFFLQAGRIL
jgi:hypothetical protein